MHNVVLDTEFCGVHHAGMELAALYLLANPSDELAVVEPSWIARVALAGRKPTDEEMQALLDRLHLDVWDDELGA